MLPLYRLLREMRQFSVQFTQSFLILYHERFICMFRKYLQKSFSRRSIQKKALEQGKVQDFSFASAGTGAWHVGNPPDKRMIATAQKYGCDIRQQKAQMFVAKHLEEYDLILTMDDHIQKHIEDHFSFHPNLANVLLFRTYDPNAQTDLNVPDPYYGGEEGFEMVWDLVNRTADNFFHQIP